MVMVMKVVVMVVVVRAHCSPNSGGDGFCIALSDTALLQRNTISRPPAVRIGMLARVFCISRYCEADRFANLGVERFQMTLTICQA